jgi:hypothetical protein
MAKVYVSGWIEVPEESITVLVGDTEKTYDTVDIGQEYGIICLSTVPELEIDSAFILEDSDG